MKLIAALIVSLLLVVFAVQNAYPVTVNFLFWQITSSLSVVIVVCIIGGILVGLAFMFGNRKRKGLRKGEDAGEKQEETFS